MHVKNVNTRFCFISNNTSHYLNQCFILRKYSYPERLQFVKDNALYFGCLSPAQQVIVKNKTHVVCLIKSIILYCALSICVLIREFVILNIMYKQRIILLIQLILYMV